MIADDLFAGAGGWDLAAWSLGIHARGVENMPEARATRDAAGLETIHDDVWTFKPHYLGRELKATGLIASPPCQTFSAAGKGSGRKALDDVLALLPEIKGMTLAELRKAGEEFGDDRTALVLTPLWFALHHPYQWLAWEQVPTVLPVWQACADVLHVEGWHVWTGLLHAEQYGVPQTRKRAFLLASRVGPVAPPTPTHSRYYSRSPEKLDEGVQKWVSMAEALGWVADGQARNSGPGAARRPREITDPSYTIRAQGSGSHPSGVEWVMRSNYGTGGDSTKRGERLASEPAPTVTSKIDRNKWIVAAGRTGEGRPRSTNEPAPTMTGKGTAYLLDSAEDWRAPTHMGDVYNSKGCIREVVDPAPTMTSSMDNGNFRWHERDENGEAVRPTSVRVTVAEAGVLQSFPADYPWQGNKGKQYLQCGNAVPPLLAWHALEAAAVHHLADEAEAEAEGVAS